MSRSLATSTSSSCCIVSRAARVHLTVHNPFILYFASAKCPADSYSLKRNKRYLNSSSLSLFPFALALSLFFSLFPLALLLPLCLSFSCPRKRAAARKFLPLGLLLHSALRSGRARGRATGAFLFTRATSCSLSLFLSFSFANFVFLSCLFLQLPQPPPPHTRSRF